ncbi:polysaccharide deacetylase family protein [Clostridium tertium]|jgi:peptidoglycan-N-acetylglucosamine deacetylase|uniref:polysaccharide deacetylase family protein n=1 Tax=Clostridium tertium TaxID=1559 RepID=UPI00232C7FFE|nr:polysaccharide deacetylase family protein [Clostridium tertium]MDB1954484.1 polysaccharide deacetylase family protein [Clostridium tertium]MDB1959467.1 polysaccharide deacetylase family protein [Clostridium tertium]MDB1963427.1 polysaccharide deacetylase family protein [Clostridium tertium]MDB1965617.1 polysaccharide deacetylase family protein [Clostridium tertium]
MWIIVIILYLIVYGIIPTLFYRIWNRKQKKNRREKEIENIYLTFDDGVDNKYTIEVLKVLKSYQIQATFFVVAEFAKNNPKIIKAIKEDGHAIGLHSLQHKNEIFQAPWNIKKDFTKSMDILKELGIKPKFFRPPWGHFSLAAINEIKKLDLKIVLWNVIVGDWKANIESTTIADRLLRETEKGDIICLHDGRGKNDAPKRTVEALKIVLPIWKSQGITFGTLEELYE